jgi:hypothetical protein
VLEPPVTKTTLSELDVNKIVNNPKLRHDINFDPDLHFRPNLDGEKGRRKTLKANDFWETMRNQLREYLTDREEFERVHGDIEWALPATLRAIRGILETLVPQRDRPSVEETFNVELLMQQFRKGVADMVKLANWLSQLLKCHCAPMRDDWVDEMVTQFSNGDKNGDVAMLALGMKNLLGVLEAMKLDVANHQIRCLRPLLLEDTVHFEQKFFMKKIEMGKVDTAGAHAWFRRSSLLPDVIAQGERYGSQGNTWDFMKALVNLTLPNSREVVPHTFLFDEERLLKLRSDMLDLINLEVCLILFRRLDASNKMQETRFGAPEDTPDRSFTSSPCNRPKSPDEMALSSPTIPSPHHFAPILRPFATNVSSRQRWSINIDDDGAASSTSPSPYSSPTSMASTPVTQPPTPFYLSVPTSDSSSQVRAHLLAILSSSTASDKWKNLSPDLALQVLRSTTTPISRLPEFEQHFASHISNAGSEVYQSAETKILQGLFPKLRELVDKYTLLTSLQIFEAATDPKAVPSFGGVPQPQSPKDEVAEIATRIAHIGILHWRVWAPLAYLVDVQSDEDTDIPMERAKSMP